MTTFDKREEGFEKKFAHDEELRFKANARRNKLLGLWAAEKLGISGDAANVYAKEVVMADFEEAGDQLRDRARKMIYQMAARECGMLEDVLARTCRLEAINVSLNRQPGSGMGDGYMVGGNFTMVVTLK